MKIFVVSRQKIEKMLNQNPKWYIGKYIISIFSKGDHSPFLDRFNILKLEFDDVTDEMYGWSGFADSTIFFNENHAKAIHEFIKHISANDKRPIFVHCDAGVSRSGAVGYILNEWFNKYLTSNYTDAEAFKETNNHILPNPTVVRMKELFGLPFQGIEVNDYELTDDGEVINHITTI